MVSLWSDITHRGKEPDHPTFAQGGASGIHSSEICLESGSHVKRQTGESCGDPLQMRPPWRSHPSSIRVPISTTNSFEIGANLTQKDDKLVALVSAQALDGNLR